MMKIDEFSATNQDPNTSCKIAAQVTGPQKPANTTQNARKICILNEQSSLMKMESGAMILPRGHLSKRKDLFLPDKHGDCIIADPRKKSWIYLSLML